MMERVPPKTREQIARMTKEQLFVYFTRVAGFNPHGSIDGKADYTVPFGNRNLFAHDSDTLRKKFEEAVTKFRKENKIVQRHQRIKRRPRPGKGELPLFIRDAIMAGQISPSATRSHGFRIRGTNGNRASAYPLWEKVKRHCCKRHVDAKLITDDYKDRKKNIRSGFLLVEILDPVCQQIEQFHKTEKVPADERLASSLTEQRRWQDETRRHAIETMPKVVRWSAR